MTNVIQGDKPGAFGRSFTNAWKLEPNSHYKVVKLKPRSSQSRLPCVGNRKLPQSQR